MMTLIPLDARAGAALEALRQEGDPLADAAVAALFERGGLRGSDLVTSVEIGARDPGACRALWEQAHDVPAWVEFPRMVAGAQMGLRNAVQAALALLLGALVESYAAARGAKVLVRSGQLEADTLRRLFRTAEFV